MILLIYVIIKQQLSKQGIHWSVSNHLVAGSSFDSLRWLVFLKSSADKLLVFNWSLAQNYFLTLTANEISCAYRSQWPDITRERSAFFTGREAVAVKLSPAPQYHKEKLTLFSMVRRWSRSTSHCYLRLVKIWQESMSYLKRNSGIHNNFTLTNTNTIFFIRCFLLV